MKKQNLLILIVFLGIVFFIFFRQFTNSKKEFYQNYNFTISKLDTLGNGRLSVNDTFLSPNFTLFLGHDIKVNDSIVKKAEFKTMFIYRNDKIVDSIKTTGLFYAH
jgi:hypothetical protein